MNPKFPLYSCLFGALVLGDAALGQVDPETLVVRASRRPMTLEAAGSSVSVITREQIERRQSIFVADLLRTVPGIAVSRSGSLGAQTQLRLRGAEANHVLVFIDGVAVNDPAIGDEFQLEHLLASDIERIEVVRGPQSALWGSDAVGGVINIRTRRPESGPPGGDGVLEAGSFGTVRAGAGWRLGRDGYGVDVRAAHFDTDGTNIARTGDEEDGYRNSSANVTARLTPSETVRLDFNARHVDSRQEFDATDFATGLPADSDRVTDGAQSYLGASVALEGAMHWDHGLELTYLDTETRNHADGEPDGTTSAEKAAFSYQGDLAVPGTAHGLTFALDHEAERFVQRGEATPFGDPNQTRRLSTTGSVIEYRARPGPALNLSASARYDASSEFDDVATYRVAASYPVGDATRVRASYGTGQKSPTFVERFGFFSDVFLGNPDLRPEQSEGWEVGFHRRLLDDALSLDMAYFDETLEDEINGFAFDVASGRFTAVNESGRSRRRGVEAEVSARVGSAVDVTASYTYLDATEPGADGEHVAEIRRPRHSGAVSVDYSFSPRASFNANVTYNGARYDTHFPPGQPAERRELGGYRLVTLAARYRLTDGLELFGRVENALDETYEDVIGFATPGAAAYAGIRADFGVPRSAR